MAECPVCGAEISKQKNTTQGEILECAECGVELEVKSLNPFELSEVQEDEDWAP
jgi:alpha-aminoadipate carrier protein LysW